MEDGCFASDALAGLSGPSLAVLETAERFIDEDSPHYQFLETHLLPEMGKLLKELRGRRFKVSQSASTFECKCDLSHCANASY